MDIHLELHALPHPNPKVRRLGFDLSHPYVEQCWGSVVGPSGIAILRRVPVLWAEREPARIATDELARSLGLGASAVQHSRFQRSLDRLVQFRMAEWLDPGAVLGVYTEAAPLTERHLARASEWTRVTHQRLLGKHLDGIAAAGNKTGRVDDLTARLDRLQQAPRHQPMASLGR